MMSIVKHAPLSAITLAANVLDEYHREHKSPTARALDEAREAFIELIRAANAIADEGAISATLLTDLRAALAKARGAQ